MATISTTELPNPFFFLGIDPRKSWDQRQFEVALGTKRDGWRRALDRGGFEGELARAHLQRIGEMQRIMADHERRTALAAEAQGKWEIWQREEQEFEAILLRLCAKGYLLESEMAGLLAAYSPILGALEIRMRAATSMRLASTADGPDRLLGEGEWTRHDEGWHRASPTVAADSDIVSGSSATTVPRGGSTSRRGTVQRLLSHVSRSRILAASGVLALIGTSAIIARFILPSDTQGTHRRAAAPSHTPGGTSQRSVFPTKGVTETVGTDRVVRAIIRQRQNAWNASLMCACDAGLEAVETGAILQNNLKQVQKFQNMGRHELEIPVSWILDWVRPESATVVLAHVSRSATEQMYQGPTLADSGMWVYQEQYRIVRQGPSWRVDRRQVLAKRSNRQPTTPAVTPLTGPPDSASVVIAVKHYLEVWKAALRSNDESFLSSVLSGEALAQGVSTIETDKARSLRQDVSDIDVPIASPVIFNDHVHATITVRRHFSDLVVDTTTSARDPSSDPNVKQLSTYSLVWDGEQWKVFRRQG